MATRRQSAVEESTVEEPVVVSTAVVQAPPPVPTAFGGLELGLQPDELTVELRPEPVGLNLARLRPRWHHVAARRGITVKVSSSEDRVRVVRLTVRSRTPGWNAGWVHWVYAARYAPHLMIGDALTAQDLLTDDDTVLNLLLLPLESREVSLQFHPVLDEHTWTGDYDIEVVAADPDSGTGIDSIPGVLKLRHPVASLLDQLPAVYREAMTEEAERLGLEHDPPFFERYLRGFEDTVQPLTDFLDNLERFFDPDEAPPDLLPWLATWVSLVLDENWPELKRRRLIHEAVELYRWRGTRRGLTRYLEIYAGVEPDVNDRPFQGMRLGPETLLGRDTILGDVPPHTFVVTLSVPDLEDVNPAVVRQIIDSVKPAHTTYQVNIVRRAAGED